MPISVLLALKVVYSCLGSSLVLGVITHIHTLNNNKAYFEP